ncbi:hypothetical protein Tco_1406761 [Tanacetum coccineum]
MFNMIIEIDTKNMEQENSVAKLISEKERLCNEINHVKQVFKEQFDSIKKTRVRTKEHSDSLIDKLNLKSAENEDLKAQIQDKFFMITSLKNDLRKLKGKEIVDISAQTPYAYTIVLGMFKLDLEPLAPRNLLFDGVHDMCLLDFVENVKSHAKSAKKHKTQNIWKPTGHVFTEVGLNWKPTGRTFTIVARVFSDLDSECSKHMTGNRSQLLNFVSKFLGTVRFRNDHIARIIGYGDYQLGHMTISRVYYVEGLGHNLFSVG